MVFRLNRSYRKESDCSYCIFCLVFFQMRRDYPIGGFVLAASETWPRARLNDLQRRWWRGENAWRIAIKLSCNEQTIWRKVKAYGFRRSPSFRRAPRRRLSLDRLSAMRAMFEAGTASWAIADKFGFTDSCSVVAWARRRGWVRPAGFYDALKRSMRLTLTAEQRARFCAAWNDPNVTFYEMSAEFGGSHPTLCRLADRFGLPPRVRGQVMQARAASNLAYRDDVIARLRAAGADDVVAAAHFGISKSQVKRSVKRSRTRGVNVAPLRRRWTPGVTDVSAVQDGYRLGVSVPVLTRLVGAPSIDAVEGLARRLELVHRNRWCVWRRILAPDVLLAFERVVGDDPVDLVQKLYRICPNVMTEVDGLRALQDYREAINRFPCLLDLTIELRGIERRQLLRPASCVIEAQRGQFRMLRREKVAA